MPARAGQQRRPQDGCVPWPVTSERTVTRRAVSREVRWSRGSGTLCLNLPTHRPYTSLGEGRQSRIMSETAHRTVSGMWWADADVAELRHLVTSSRPVVSMYLCGQRLGGDAAE